MNDGCVSRPIFVPLYTSISKKVVAAESNKQQHKTANNICILLLIRHLDAIILVVL
jgi:hypothetical protein